MIRRLSLIIAMLLVAFFLSISCAVSEPIPEATPEEAMVEQESLLLTEEVCNCFEELHTNAMDEIDLEIADLDGEIALIEEKATALMQITTQIDDAISILNEEVAKESLKTGMYWYFILPKEEYYMFLNKYFEISEFELRWLARTKEELWELTKRSIKIRDRETGVDGPPHTFEEKLERQYSDLISNKNAMIKAKEEAVEMLAAVLDKANDWGITEISSMVYLISGYGLGYNEQLCLGEWYYYEDSKTVEPKSSSASKLRDMIVAED